ncbi:hypothetical protein PGSY75_0929300 [Plasmodium gaboni]|uniref:Uncharacterized protein n=1 Tax=Plasmodium gaboni TaxID=647221 RepID=A0A151LM83_9APIC|nr:hypothetical protein PGSY75_0929300 [Plasmodium gaboni]KYO00272.1 hypothetical protein PGSY75_0929300 [Plasmodium gaboni]
MKKLQEIIREFINLRSRVRRRYKKKKENEKNCDSIYSNEKNCDSVYSNEETYYYEKRNLYNLYKIIKCYYYLLTRSIKHEKWKRIYKEEKKHKRDKKKCNNRKTFIVEEEKKILLKKRIQKEYVHKIKNYIIMNRNIHAFKFLLEEYVYMNKYNDFINGEKIEIKIKKKRRQKQKKRKRNIRISMDKNVLFNKFISYIIQFIYNILERNNITNNICSNNITNNICSNNISYNMCSNNMTNNMCSNNNFSSFFQKMQMNKYELSNDGNNMNNSNKLSIINNKKKKKVKYLLYKNNNHMLYNDLNSPYYYNSFILKTIDSNLLYVIDNDFDLMKILFFFQVPHLFIMYMYIITCNKNNNLCNYYDNIYHKIYMSLLLKIMNEFYSSFILTYNELVSNKKLIILFKIFSNILKKNHILLFKWLRCYKPIYKLNERDKKNKKENEPIDNNIQHYIKRVDKKDVFFFSHRLEGTTYPSDIKKIKEHEKTKQEDVSKKYISQGTYLVDYEYEERESVSNDDRNKLNKVKNEKGDKYKIKCRKEMEGFNLLLRKKDEIKFAFLNGGSFLYGNLFNYFKGNEEKKKEIESTTCDDSNTCHYESMCDKDNDEDNDKDNDSDIHSNHNSNYYYNNYNYNGDDSFYHHYVKGENEIDCINFTVNVINNQEDNIRFYKSYIKEHIDSMFLSKYNLKVSKKFGSTLNDESKKKKKRTEDKNNTGINNTSIFDNYKELVQNFFLVKKVF